MLAGSTNSVRQEKVSDLPTMRTFLRVRSLTMGLMIFQRRENQEGALTIMMTRERYLVGGWGGIDSGSLEGEARTGRACVHQSYLGVVLLDQVG